MFTRKQAPFIWITISYIIGILAENWTSLPNANSTYFLAFLLLAVLGHMIIVRDQLYFYFLVFTIGLTGYFHASHVHAFIRNQSDTLFSVPTQVYVGTILEVKQSKNHWRAVIKIIAEGPDKIRHKDGPKLLVYLAKESTSKPNLREVVQIEGKPMRIPGPVNPHSFNFRKYMERKRVYYQVFLKKDEWYIVSSEADFSLIKWFDELNDKASCIIWDKFEDEENASLLNALFLGNKDMLSDPVLEAFGNTGARHVLAVSGMHVGMILLIIEFLFSFIRFKWKGVMIVRTLLVVFLIWSYALLVGAQPAVLRASFMLSVLYFGKILNLFSNHVNSLFFSAFVLLIHDPFLLYQLSFLFSYLALLSILLFFAPISSWVKPKFKIFRYLWQILAISIAAQIFMMPLALFFFHKIPFLFLLAALISTPLSFILLAGMVLFFMDQLIFGWLEPIFTYILNEVASVFLKSITVLDELPFGTMDHIFLNVWGLIYLFLGMVLLFVGLKKRKVNFLIVSILVFDLFMLHRIVQKNRAYNQSEIVIYATSGPACMDIFLGPLCYNWNSSGIPDKSSGFSTEGHRMYNLIKEIAYLQTDSRIQSTGLKSNNNHIRIEELVISIFNENTQTVPKVDRIDILLIDIANFDAKSSVLDQLANEYRVNTLVFSKRVPYRLTRVLEKKFCLADSIWNISREGAYVFQIKNKYDVEYPF